jgi:hypothetical protein
VGLSAWILAFREGSLEAVIGREQLEPCEWHRARRKVARWIAF